MLPIGVGENERIFLRRHESVFVVRDRPSHDLVGRIAEDVPVPKSRLRVETNGHGNCDGTFDSPAVETARPPVAVPGHSEAFGG